MALKIEDFRRMDINYRYYHGDLHELMQKAGEAVASAVAKKFGVGNRILTVCGTGNKAGDGLVAAEKLREDNTVIVIFVKGKTGIGREDAKKALENYKGESAGPEDLEKELNRSDVVIDALLGTGISGEPRSPYDEIISKLNDSRARRVSIDVPSGFGTRIAVKPDITVTFHDLKEGMTPANSGEIEIIDIGIPKEIFTVAGPGDLASMKMPEPGAHKGMNGVLGIIGGWTYHGSAIISALGAMAMGPDLVDIIVPPERYDLLSSFSPEIIVRPFIGVDRLAESLQRYSALVIGPGLGEDREIRKMLFKLLGSVNIPTVIDADAIRLLSGEEQLFSGKPIVFTPHAKEFEMLTGNQPSEDALRAFCQKTNTVMVLKGQQDLISDGNSVFRTEGGNARLAMGGTGDLLAGVIGGLLSKGLDRAAASRLGTYLVKKAGSDMFGKKAYWYSVSDLVNELPFTVKETWEFCRE